VFICIIKTITTTMKKFLSNSNPFILILIPVLFALLMGVSYQFEQKASSEVQQLGQLNVKQSTSLFYKGVGLVKTVCSVAKQIVW
jgi:hypothetical protein